MINSWSVSCDLDRTPARRDDLAHAAPRCVNASRDLDFPRPLATLRSRFAIRQSELTRALGHSNSPSGFIDHDRRGAEPVAMSIFDLTSWLRSLGRLGVRLGIILQN